MKKDKPIKNHNTTSTGKSKHEFPAIENKLLECARKGKPVFLYDKNSIDRKAMVINISKEMFKKHRFISRKKMDGSEKHIMDMAEKCKITDINSFCGTT